MTIEQYDSIELEHGGGGQKSSELISVIRAIISDKGKWKNSMDDGATLKIGNQYLVFTTDAYIVDPIYFPGGDIGKISVCGTINDLAMMGAVPQGLSLSMVIEEGFPKRDLIKIVESIKKMSQDAGVPIVTGDTKVMPKGKIDKIEITTAGVGLAKKIISNDGIKKGDIIISSGDLGEHTVALLSERFNYETNLVSDSKTLHREIKEVGKFLHSAKDPTRGGLSANIIEMSEKSKVKIILEEELLPYKKETMALAGLLGLDVFSFASEGRFICAVGEKDAEKVLKILKKFNKEAKIIGHAEKPVRPASTVGGRGGGGSGVFLKTELGSLRRIEMPRGKLVPRIC